MVNTKNNTLVILVLISTISFIITLYIWFNTYGYLVFSDAAKFADMARNILAGEGYKSSFSFGVSGVFNAQETIFPSPWTPPLMPLSIALFFRLFGISDAAVMSVSLVYFVLLLIFVFLLGKKLFGKLVGSLSALAVTSSVDFLNYATNGSTESLFALEILSASYFITLKKNWSTIFAFSIMFLSYFTRPQAFIYIAGLLFYWLLINFKIKKALLYFAGVLVTGFLFDYFVLSKFAGKYFLYSVTVRGLGTATQIASGGSASDSLRGAVLAESGFLTVFKKIFYNIYNFYRLMPQILNPYLFALFVIGLFRWGKNKLANYFKISVLFMFGLTLLVAAASIPFFRYIHPVVPLVYIIAVTTLVWIVGKIYEDIKELSFLYYKLKRKITKQKFMNLASSFMILLFSVGQTLGIIFLDSRFERKIKNVGKPPVYVKLAEIIKSDTDPGDIVITNLDTWGSWYGERRTVWFPIEPSQIINPKTGEIPFDAIYLTSYLMDDQNYYMGEAWRQIFLNPENPELWECAGCSQIAAEFELKNIYEIEESENYEKQNARAVLFVRK